MKAGIFIGCVIVLLFICGTAFSETVYLKARVAALQSEADSSSSRVGILRQGEQLDVAKQQGSWLQVKVLKSGRSGWIQKQFVASDPVVKPESNSVSSLGTVNSRRRASAYSTSAAATRGLSSEDVRARSNVSFAEYDFEAVKWLEDFIQVKDEEVFEFAESQGFSL